MSGDKEVIKIHNSLKVFNSRLVLQFEVLHYGVEIINITSNMPSIKLSALGEYVL